jgi:RNA 2',3'-cyclic 3'-phosphodiesterase
MRLFTGVGLPQNVIDDLTRLLEGLRPTAHLKWSAPYNLHVTTKFIGEWPEERLDELTAALSPLSARGSIQIAIEETGWFPSAKSPRVLYAGIKAGPELGKLAEDTNEAVATLGIERETKKFEPHLTLARIKDSAVPLSRLRAAIDNLATNKFSRFTATAFSLYLSKPGPAGSIYTQLAEFPFQN